MTQEQKDLYEQIDILLWEEWDPIGINDYEEARDEYYNYLPKVYELRIRNASKKEIADYLFEIETDRMGLSGNKDKCLQIAQKLIELSYR